jgi:hypothetical protein
LVFINAEIAVETWFRIAFANDKEEPAKGPAGEGLAMPCHAARHAVTALMVARFASRAASTRVNVMFSRSTVRVCVGERMSRADHSS